MAKPIAGFRVAILATFGGAASKRLPIYDADTMRVEIAGSSDNLVFYSVYDRYRKVRTIVPNASDIMTAGISSASESDIIGIFSLYKKNHAINAPSNAPKNWKII